MPKNVGELGKLIVAKGYEELPKDQKIAQSGHIGNEQLLWVVGEGERNSFSVFVWVWVSEEASHRKYIVKVFYCIQSNDFRILVVDFLALICETKVSQPVSQPM